MGFFGWLALGVGWVLALVLFVLGDAARDSVKKLVAGRIDALERGISGSRWARRRALARYRRTVVERLALVPVPFELPVDIPMEDVYIRLSAADTPEAAAKTVDLGTAVKDHRRTLVLGEPGAGKSLFLRHLLWSLCANRNDPTLAVIVPLARLAESRDVAAEVTAALGQHRFADAEDFVRRELDRTSPELLVLFDGLDEVGSEARPEVCAVLGELSQQHPRLRFVVTCRAQVYGGTLDGIVDKTLYVQPLTDDLVERFLRVWPAMRSRESVDRLVNVLQQTPRVALLVRNPLLLTMLAYLYSSEYKESTTQLPQNRFQFYRDASDLLLRRWQEKHNRFRPMDKKVVLQHLALVNQKSDADRRGIDYEQVLKEIRAVMPRVDLPPDQAKDLLDEIVDRSGLLMRLDAGERYQFAHLTMQEYFAAVELLDQPKQILQLYEADPEAWREPVRLWCGGEQDSTTVIRRIAGIDRALALECLADATRVSDVYADRLVEETKSWLLGDAGPAESVAELARALGVLASDRRPRGRRVLDFLRESARSAARDRVAMALAASNLPEAANTLAEVAVVYPDVVPHLTRMGNVAVPALLRLGGNVAIDTLAEIGTPPAAHALVQFLWHPIEALADLRLTPRELDRVKEACEDRDRRRPKPGVDHPRYDDELTHVQRKVRALLARMLSNRTTLASILFTPTVPAEVTGRDLSAIRSGHMSRSYSRLEIDLEVLNLIELRQVDRARVDHPGPPPAVDRQALMWLLVDRDDPDLLLRPSASRSSRTPATVDTEAHYVHARLVAGQTILGEVVEHQRLLSCRAAERLTGVILARSVDALTYVALPRYATTGREAAHSERLRELGIDVTIPVATIALRCMDLVDFDEVFKAFFGSEALAILGVEEVEAVGVEGEV